ncbi:hypothetical protein B0T26DRAFT_698026 [Lasiosphaeria miniovina]|uniref:Uncharacterized protein n=1 Tax=Lasiosphaeria miniovina TaxID=1954250 RepID=A0AA40B682_9PEZI|nr:uncharacterized protein B0T26DRAFT_698026 [Lasiosphaeria miniovina]KAK0728460.1 hypothetical protein B0T26DRAFT_698026 [Lasiosphaeria miniovina]
MITQGMGLEKVVPRSSTLLHEAFHALFGTGPTGFLEGDEVCQVFLVKRALLIKPPSSRFSVGPLSNY